ncbi:MAG: CPBP family glutamic-type intramembrane protease [Candidatus Limnocylindrales bacterium]
MDELILPFGLLIVLAFTMLLVMLRFQAALFGVAEYADTGPDGRPTGLRRRLSWYLVGLLIIVAITKVDPNVGSDLYVGLGDRNSAVLLGLAFGIAGSGLAVGVAVLRYGHLRLPSMWSYPEALLNSLGTAFIDEVTFRGALLGFLYLVLGLNGWLAIVIQTLIYGLATRLGAPGRDRSIFVLALVLGVATGWATIVTGGIGASFIGHTIGRFAMFLTTGHAGQPLPAGREVEEIERRRRPPDGWSIVGAVRDSISRDR